MAELYRDAAPLSPDAIYRVARTKARPVTLMPGHDRAWRSAQRIGWGPARYRTDFRALWNDEGLAIRFDACDDRPWHTMQRPDDPIWEEEVVEIFLDPACLGQHYAEVEISPINVVTDLHILEPHPRLDGDRSWNWRGLESTVVPGSCGGLTPGSWVALAWLPWSGLGSLGPEVAARVPPSAGDALAVQRVPHQAAPRPGGARTRRRLRRMVHSRGAELPRTGGIPEYGILAWLVAVRSRRSLPRVAAGLRCAGRRISASGPCSC